MFCSNCGQSVVGVSFCTECGKPVGEVSTHPSISVAPPPPPANQGQAVQAAPEPPPYPAVAVNAGAPLSSGSLYRPQIPGFENRTLGLGDLAVMAKNSQIKPDTVLIDAGSNFQIQAKQLQGVFSDKQYLVALILSIFLGVLGVDRFYTGQIGAGIGKLLTWGGFGIWWIIDIILYATRSVTDKQGRPLS